MRGERPRRGNEKVRELEKREADSIHNPGLEVRGCQMMYSSINIYIHLLHVNIN